MSVREPSDRPRLSLTSVRYATAGDVAHLARIESAGDHVLGAVLDVSAWPESATGEHRAATESVLLAAGQPAVAFAHLVELTSAGRSWWHLARIAVHPAAARRGIGTMLLRAAMGVVLDRGGRELTLLMDAGVAWHAPWYAREGFVEVSAHAHPEVWGRLASLRDAERGRELTVAGRRVSMLSTLADEPEPRPAVSVIPVRSRRGALEVFIQHRALTMDFAPGAVVFPGGRVDPIDVTTAYRQGISVARACAVREVAEESGAVVDPSALIPWDRWVTPVRYPKRFDVEFFLLPVAAGDEFVHQTAEATHSQWLSVAALVRGAEEGTMTLVPPTRTIVDELSALGTMDAVLALKPTVLPVRHDLAGRRPRA